MRLPRSGIFFSAYGLGISCEPGCQVNGRRNSYRTSTSRSDVHESECQAIRSLVFAEEKTSPKNRDLVAEHPEEPMPTQPIVPDKLRLAQHLGTGSPRSLLTRSIWVRATPRGTGRGCRLTHLRTGGSIAQLRLVATTRSLRQVLGLLYPNQLWIPKADGSSQADASVSRFACNK